jgi:catechol 2,3-dioxygenase-like lactoylglutathione lyase family enzyme
MMVATANQLYNVGGVLVERPFKVRRLGHVGFHFLDMPGALHFYRDLLGFRISDYIDWGTRIDPAKLEGLDPRTYFTRFATDHHSFVFGSKKVREIARPGASAHGRDDDMGQMSWQVDSLAETVNVTPWLKERGVTITRVGRDMPGSNWHTYFLDPEGHNNELFYGMEQIGWDGVTKPKPMYADGFAESPPLPQRSESQEVEDMIARGVRPEDGYRDPEEGPFSYDVDGILLPRPFRVTGIGPLGLFVFDMDAELSFYTEMMGFRVTESVQIQGETAHFLGAGQEHHSLALYPIALKERMGVPAQSTCAVIGFQVGSYKQLRNAVAFMKSEGVPVFETPLEFHTGIDYAAHFLDQDGHCVRLYHAMEPVDWDGNPRPQDRRQPKPVSAWPETLSDGANAFAANVFQGPLG